MRSKQKLKSGRTRGSNRIDLYRSLNKVTLSLLRDAVFWISNAYLDRPETIGGCCERVIGALDLFGQIGKNRIETLVPMLNRANGHCDEPASKASSSPLVDFEAIFHRARQLLLLPIDLVPLELQVLQKMISQLLLTELDRIWAEEKYLKGAIWHEYSDRELAIFQVQFYRTFSVASRREIFKRASHFASYAEFLEMAISFESCSTLYREFIDCGSLVMSPNDWRQLTLLISPVISNLLH